MRFADSCDAGRRDLVSTSANVFSLAISDADDMRRRAAEMEAFLATCDPRSVACHVRIRLDLYLEVRDGRGLRERDFRVLCALKSTLGQKPYMRVSREWLRVRAAGFLRPEEASAAPAPGETGGSNPNRVLTLQEVRTSLRSSLSRCRRLSFLTRHTLSTVRQMSRARGFSQPIPLCVRGRTMVPESPAAGLARLRNSGSI